MRRPRKGTRLHAASLVMGVMMAAGCRADRLPSEPSERTQPGLSQAELRVVRAPTGRAIPGRYIVVFKPSVRSARDEALQTVSRYGGRIAHSYEHALRGFAGELPDAALAALRRNPLVQSIEEDQIAYLDAVQSPTPSWGLDRIDQRSLPGSNSYRYDRTGAGVHFYGLDTGVNLAHADLAGRLANGFDAVTPGGNANDCHGHGTHTATTAAGTTYGVAKGMTVHPVRVIPCSGFGQTSTVIAGVDWVTGHRIRPAVANMSIGFSPSSALDNAVAASVGSGVIYAVSAGNDGGNACNKSPARAYGVITVASSNQSDVRASSSNFGTCVELFAPGVGITAGWIGSPTATAPSSGTSMAAPHVAGAGGLYLQVYPNATPAQFSNALLSYATYNKISNPGSGTPNRLLFVITNGNVGPVAAFNAPTCRINVPCTFDASPSFDDQGIVTYQWHFAAGDPSASSGKIVTHMYRSGPLETSASLTVTDASGATGYVSKAVSVYW